MEARGNENGFAAIRGAAQISGCIRRGAAPLCERTGMAQGAVDILLFLANNPGLDTARDICLYRV